jgi:hypothetical protein
MASAERKSGPQPDGSWIIDTAELFEAREWALKQSLREGLPEYFESETDGGVIVGMGPNLLVSIIDGLRAEREEQDPQELPDSIFVQGKMEFDVDGGVEITHERVKVAKFVENPPNSPR